MPVQGPPGRLISRCLNFGPGRDKFVTLRNCPEPTERVQVAEHCATARSRPNECRYPTDTEDAGEHQLAAHACSAWHWQACRSRGPHCSALANTLCLLSRLGPGNPQFPFPRFPIWPGDGEGIPDSRRISRLGRNRESGSKSPVFPICRKCRATSGLLCYVAAALKLCFLLPAGCESALPTCRRLRPR